MIARIFVYLLLMIVFPCLYVDMRYLRRKRFGRVWVRVLWWLPGFCMAVYTVILAMHRDFAPADTTVLNFYLFLLGMLVVPNFVFALCSVVGLGVKKLFGTRDVPGIVFFTDCAHAGPRAAADLSQKTNAGTIFKYRSLTGAKLKNLLQNLNRILDALRIGIRTVKTALFIHAAPVIGHTGKVFGADFQVRVAFVVSE